jgi:hypothetical protein
LRIVRETADGPKVGLNDFVGIVHEAFHIGVETPEALTAGDQYIHFPGQSRWTFEVVAQRTAPQASRRLLAGAPLRRSDEPVFRN